MTRRSPQEVIDALRNYHPNKYDSKTHLVQEMTLMHSVKIPTSGGGEFPLNNANTKNIVGVSDFTGVEIPSDAIGLIRAVIIRYGEKTCAVGVDGATKDPAAPDGNTHTTPAIIDYMETRSNFPPWLLQTELVAKTEGQELFRIRISELVPSAAPDRTPYEWAKELEKLIKTIGGQTLQLYLNIPEGASDPSASKDEYVQVILYGVKIAPRTKA